MSDIHCSRVIAVILVCYQHYFTDTSAPFFSCDHYFKKGCVVPKEADVKIDMGIRCSKQD